MDKDTVQVELDPEFMVEGAQATELRTAGGAVKLIEAVAETPLKEAVTMADASTEIVPATAEKVAID